MDTTEVLPRETRDLIHRIGERPVAERMAMLLWLHEDLRLQGEAVSPVDAALIEREAALRAIRVVARKLGEEPESWPTVREFREHAEDGWSVRRVQKAFGCWQAAIDTLKGVNRPAAVQRKYRRKIAGRGSGYEAPLPSLREWLATEPVVRDRDTYNGWARLCNNAATPEDDAALKPSAATVADLLLIPFGEAVRVASGEIQLEDAIRSLTREKRTWSDGVHDFVSRTEVGHMLGKNRQEVRRLANQANFPLPVLVLGNTPAWLRGDIEDFAARQPVAKREPDELRPFYLNSADLAATLGVTTAALRQPMAHAPDPTGAICGKHIWDRVTVERWLVENAPSPYSGRARMLAASSVRQGH